jgi:3-isopropylmalate dehydratase small subunit
MTWIPSVELNELILSGTAWVVEGTLSSEEIVSLGTQGTIGNAGQVLLSTGTMGEGQRGADAAIALQHSAVCAVIAPAFAWQFFRVCLNLGLPPLTLWEAGEIRMGDRLRVDVHGQVVKNLSSGTRYPIRDLSDLYVTILACGGVVEYLQTFRAAKEEPRAES